MTLKLSSSRIYVPSLPFTRVTFPDAWCGPSPVNVPVGSVACGVGVYVALAVLFCWVWAAGIVSRDSFNFVGKSWRIITYPATTMVVPNKTMPLILSIFFIPISITKMAYIYKQKQFFATIPSSVMKNDNEEKFQKAQAELNQKIQAIMGPTPSGDEPTKGVDISSNANAKKAESKPSVGTAPEVPPKAAGAQEPAEAPKKPVGPEVEETKEPEPDTNVPDEEIQEPPIEEPPETEDKPAEAEKPTDTEPKKGFKQKLKAWLKNPKVRKTLLILFIVTIIALAIVPYSRYFLLNTAGIRSKASITVLDDSTQQPLKNVRVTLDGQSSQTDGEGKVTLQKVKLGGTVLRIEKRAFAPVDKKVTVGWGSNPLGQVKLTPVGVQYSFVITDFLSNKPIEKATATSGEADATSDEEGKLVITLDKDDEQSEVVIKAKDYRDENRTLNAESKTSQAVKMVPAHKHTFVSKRSGKFDVYKIDVDGQNEELALAGSGAERDDMVLVPHPTDNVVAVVSTRDNIRNRDGFLLSTFNLINLNENRVTTVSKSERIQVFGWAGNKIVYVEVAAGASANSPKRHRLLSYDPKKQENTELAAANYFNDVLLIGNVVYYAPSSAFQNGTDVSLFRLNVDTNNKQVVFNKETWNVFRTDYDHLTLAVQQDWYDYNLATQKPPERITPPPNPKTRVYIPSPDNSKSIWVDQRDGKGVLIVYDASSKKETTLKSQSGLKYPLSWVSGNTIVYRINTEQETADYVLNLDGGEPQKIKDVTNTGGVDKWYYY